MKRITRRITRAVSIFIIAVLLQGFACNASQVRKHIRTAASGVSSVLTALEADCAATPDLCERVRTLKAMLDNFDANFPTVDNGQALRLLSDIVTAFRAVIQPLQNISSQIKTYLAITDAALRWLAIYFDNSISRAQRAPLPAGSEAGKQRQVLREYLNSPKIEK